MPEILWNQKKLEWWGLADGHKSFKVDLAGGGRAGGGMRCISNLYVSGVRSWERTSVCYQQLIRDCSGDSQAVSVLRAHLRRYLVYSRPCLDRSQRSKSCAMHPCTHKDARMERLISASSTRPLNNDGPNSRQLASRVRKTDRHDFLSFLDNFIHRKQTIEHIYNFSVSNIWSAIFQS